MLLPVLVIVMAAFIPFTTVLSTGWATSRIQTTLQDASRHLADTISQLYFAVNQSQISPGTIRQASDLPPSIENYVYTATGTTANADGSNSVKILLVTLTLQGKIKTSASTSIPLGVNVNLVSSTLTSSSPTASIILQKFTNGTISIAFG